MAYVISWDEGVPIGITTPAADIDIEIQKVKESLRERLEQVMPDFDDDSLDPKKLTIDSDVIASRPASADYAGQLYFAYDTPMLYIANAALEWVATGGSPEEGDDDTPSASFSVTAALTASYNLPSDTNWHVLSGYTVIGSRGTLYSAGAPTRFTIPAAGDYKFSSVFTLASGSAVSMDVGYGIDGGSPSATAFAHRAGAVEGGYPLEFILYSAVVGTYIEFWVKQASGTGSAWVYSSGYTHVTTHRLP